MMKITANGLRFQTNGGPIQLYVGSTLVGTLTASTFTIADGITFAGPDGGSLVPDYSEATTGDVLTVPAEGAPDWEAIPT